MRLAHRIDQLPPYLFYEISKRVAEKRAKGEDVISLAIGDPDLPTPDHIIQSLQEASLNPATATRSPTPCRSCVRRCPHYRVGRPGRGPYDWAGG